MKNVEVRVTIEVVAKDGYLNNTTICRAEVADAGERPIEVKELADAIARVTADATRLVEPRLIATVNAHHAREAEDQDRKRAANDL